MMTDSQKGVMNFSSLMFLIFGADIRRPHRRR